MADQHEHGELDPVVAQGITKHVNEDGTVTLMAEDVPFTVSADQAPFGDIRPDALLWRKNVQRLESDAEGNPRLAFRNMQMWGVDFHRLVQQIGFANVLDYVAYLESNLDAWVITGSKHQDESNFECQHPLPHKEA